MKLFARGAWLIGAVAVAIALAGVSTAQVQSDAGAQLRQDCRAGDAKDCITLAGMYEAGGYSDATGVHPYEKSLEKASGALQFGCRQLKNGPACEVLIERIRSKKLSDPGDEVTLEVYRISCQNYGKPGGWSCVYAGDGYSDGRGAPRNLVLAAMYYSMGCKAGNSSSCKSEELTRRLDGLEKQQQENYARRDEIRAQQTAAEALLCLKGSKQDCVAACSKGEQTACQRLQ